MHTCTWRQTSPGTHELSSLHDNCLQVNSCETKKNVQLRARMYVCTYACMSVCNIMQVCMCVFRSVGGWVLGTSMYTHQTNADMQTKTSTTTPALSTQEKSFLLSQKLEDFLRVGGPGFSSPSFATPLSCTHMQLGLMDRYLSMMFTAMKSVTGFSLYFM